MHHVLTETATALIGSVGTYREIVVLKHAPGADHFDPLRLVGLNQKVIFHLDLLEIVGCLIMQ
jgi:hypothetical protein